MIETGAAGLAGIKGFLATLTAKQIAGATVPFVIMTAAGPKMNGAKILESLISALLAGLCAAAFAVYLKVEVQDTQIAKLEKLIEEMKSDQDRRWNSLETRIEGLREDVYAPAWKGGHRS